MHTTNAHGQVVSLLNDERREAKEAITASYRHSYNSNYRYHQHLAAAATATAKEEKEEQQQQQQQQQKERAEERIGGGARFGGVSTVAQAGVDSSHRFQRSARPVLPPLAHRSIGVAANKVSSATSSSSATGVLGAATPTDTIAAATNPNSPPPPPPPPQPLSSHSSSLLLSPSSQSLFRRPSATTASSASSIDYRAEGSNYSSHAHPAPSSLYRENRQRLPSISSISSSARPLSLTTLPYHSSSSSSSVSSTTTAATAAERPRLQHRSAYSTADSHDFRTVSYSSDNSSPTEASSPDTRDSPCFSPGAAQITPQLHRNDSGSSSRSLSTPSPMTPTYGFDPLDQNKQVPLASGLDPYARSTNGPYFGQGQMPMATSTDGFFFPQNNAILPLDATSVANFMPVSASTLPIAPYATDLIQPTPQFNPAVANVSSPNPAPAANANNATDTAQSSASSASNPQQQKARKKYPCPHAQRYGCTDTFTTSGHAARHGKKHTGEKNIHCPTCHKAFTRKDNMKQHERTHRNNRDSVGSATDGSSKRGKTSHNSNNSITNASTISDSGPGSAALPAADIDLDFASSTDPHATLRASTTSSSRPSILSPSSLDFNAMANGAGVSFADADLEAGGPSPGDDELQYGAVTDMAPMAKRPAGAKREFSNGGTSQDGEGESPGLDALAMAASSYS